jgi:spermidine synthase
VKGTALLLACFFLSGFAALIYQTAWTRQLAFVFGTSELAVATVLASYMAGLAVGAAAAARLVGSVRRPLRVYGLLELGIALTALAVPAAIDSATGLYVGIFGGKPAPPDAQGLARSLFYLGSSFSILLIPTALMGATLPLLVRQTVQKESEIGSRVGQLYATNTAGAVAGAVATGFLLLPTLGLERTIWVGVAANGLVFGGAMLLARGTRSLDTAPESAQARSIPRSPGRWILPLVLVSGAVSFSYEVLWSRLLTHLLGGSLQGFATMLATLLTGIALGSAIASRFARSPDRAARGFAWAQLGTAALSLMTFALLDRVPTLLRKLSALTGANLFVDAAAGAAILLPAALCIGATFPFAVRVLARHGADAGPASARVFAWNTVGAIIGAVGAGFFLVPILGYSGALTLGVATNLALALAAALAGTGKRWRVACVVAAGLCFVAVLPLDPPWSLLRASALGGNVGAGKTVYFGVGRSATVLLVRRNGGWRLLSNGLSEAHVVPRGGNAVGSSVLPHWLGAMASLVRPEARSLLVVGLGGGSVLEAVPRLIDSIDVVELEPEVIAANRVIASQRREDPLSDPRVRLVVNDARAALMLTDKHYDAIVSQPSHPWRPGASHLFTREFFELARDHLVPSGVLVQWITPRFADASLLQTLVATLLEVFPHVHVYGPARGVLLLVASAEPLATEESVTRAIASAPEDFAELGVFGPEDVAAARILDERGARAFSEGASSNTDDRNFLEMRSFAIARRDVESGSLARALAPHDALARPSAGFDRAYLVRRLLARRLGIRARRAARAASDPVERATAQALIEVAAGRLVEGRHLFERALELDPQAREARAGLLRLQRTAIVTGAAAAQALASGLEDPEAAVVEGWRAEAARNWKEARDLDSRLAGVRPQDPLFADAMRLRIGWRLAEGEPSLVREVVTLSDELGSVTGSAGDLLLRARALAVIGDAAGATVTLFQTANRLRPAPADRPVRQEALRLLSALEPDASSERERKELEARLRSAR